AFCELRMTKKVWFSLAIEREHPDRPTAQRPFDVSEELAIRGPIRRESDAVHRLQKGLFRAGPVGSLQIKTILSVAKGGVNDPAAIGRPHRIKVSLCRTGPKRQRRFHAAQEVVTPDVVAGRIQIVCDSLSVPRHAHAGKRIRSWDRP